MDLQESIPSSDPAIAVLGALRKQPSLGSQTGLCFGAYQVLQEIGSSRTGSVYLAVRDHDFSRQYAIKLMRSSLVEDRELRRRFRAEREILARLDHPNIARMIDGGTTEGGIPFLVMEYVEGRPIHVECSRRRLNTKRRLELLHKICSALALAHENGIVHLDLKPANILVTSHGEPVLLDFGVGEMLYDTPANRAPQLVDDENVTDFSLLPSAPPVSVPFASPEQLNGDEITARSDVYGFGALLYRLLVGGLACRLERHRDPQAMIRAICEEPPIAPSRAALSQVRASRRRDGDPQALNRALRGNLDHILLRALEKDPFKRYPSATELAADLETHLAGGQVLGLKDRFVGRLQNWLGSD